jgi:hypothetical protein
MVKMGHDHLLLHDRDHDRLVHNFLHKICHMKMMGFDDDNDEVGSDKKGWGLGKEGRKGGRNIWFDTTKMCSPITPVLLLTFNSSFLKRRREKKTAPLLKSDCVRGTICCRH